VAEHLNLEPDWLNDDAKAFLPGEDENRIGVYDRTEPQRRGGVAPIASCHETNGIANERDQDDIRELYKLCEFTTSEQGLELLVSYYPEI